MAHLFAPQNPESELPVFFNVDGVVGAAPAQNKREDVLLVQFVYQVIAASPRPTTNPKVLIAARAVRVTGSIDQATIAAIRATQEGNKALNPGVIVDGRVSPVKAGYTYAKQTPWTIVNLNDSLQDRNLDVWPRIDKILGCPDDLKKMVTRQVAGT
jgi:hypothetical protein